MRVGVVAAVVVFVSGGALPGCAAEPSDESVSVTVDSPIPTAPKVPRTTSAPTPTNSPSARPKRTPTVALTPVVTRRLVMETRKIAFRKVTQTDPSLAKGQKVVTAHGVPGTKRLTFELTLTDGVQTGKRLVSQVVVRAPVAQVTSIGTKVEPQPAGNCDPNYTGDCVPIASDVDCSSGTGNGPAYVDGPVEVVGTDIYGLDRDNDGIGCED
ncbi:surface rod structure-forming protein G [Kribbella orskensis]|uniref:Surface rod structure-forming protein G n=1 Tax=Kribbella orskensis TaxID=2512216 RepID=A0ABY2BR80_9ACTN|nr:surface rod structure-forming protein G [Kribbella sp. VKM Ac-2500]TCO27950.1 surface rod structure-forming protein G [Kribbella orskensis]